MHNNKGNEILSDALSFLKDCDEGTKPSRNKELDALLTKYRQENVHVHMLDAKERIATALERIANALERKL